MSAVLTREEKAAMRALPCGRCGKAPPFPQWGGQRCHVHRVVPGWKGGLYTKENATPRCPGCHDIEHGGDGSAPLLGHIRPAGWKHSDEARAKISEAGRGRRHTLGKRLSVEHKEKISAANRGRKLSIETRKRISDSHRDRKVSVGRKHSAETRAKMSASRMGREVSAETRKKLSARNSGWEHSAEARAKISVAKMGTKASSATRSKMSSAHKAIWAARKAMAEGCQP